MKKNDGGTAANMTLRQFYAAGYGRGLVAASFGTPTYDNENEIGLGDYPAKTARRAFELADEMIAFEERELSQ